MKSANSLKATIRSSAFRTRSGSRPMSAPLNRMFSRPLNSG